MKKSYTKILALTILVGASITATAQVENVGIGTISPDNSAVLDIQSADKGLLIPRMSIQQRDGIKNPANGLMIYQTGKENGFYFYDGSLWKPLSDTDAKSVATLDVNGWALDGNASANANKAAASALSFIGTPSDISLNFKIGTFRSGLIQSNATGGNTGIGFTALNAVSTGLFNVGFGAFAASNTTTGSFNFAIGASALESNIGGSSNIALGTSALILNQNGSSNIAIGTNAGRSTLGSGNVFIGNAAAQNETGSNKLYIANTNTTMPLVYGDFSAKYVTIGDVTPALRAQGIATGGYNLLVKGGILTEKVKVAIAAAGTDWADYVFEPEYKAKMMSLEEVEQFTLVNKHLPNVPSAEKMVEVGLDVAQTSKMFMEKIEELTLYIIDMNKEIKALKAERDLLKK